MANKMADVMAKPISEYTISLSEVFHAADMVAFEMQASAQFKASSNDELAKKWKANAKKRLISLQKAVKVLADEVESL